MPKNKKNDDKIKILLFFFLEFIFFILNLVADTITHL